VRIPPSDDRPSESLSLQIDFAAWRFGATTRRLIIHSARQFTRRTQAGRAAGTEPALGKISW
jgi:hypothetical protein